VKTSIAELTAWLTEERDLTAARLAYLIREKGVDTKTAVCAKIFPDKAEPTGGVVITPGGEVFQFSYNGAGMIFEMAVIDGWTNITATYKDHPWRDDILAGLAMIQ
jgi:hypothetical protein